MDSDLDNKEDFESTFDIIDDDEVTSVKGEVHIHNSTLIRKKGWFNIPWKNIEYV